MRGKNKVALAVELNMYKLKYYAHIEFQSEHRGGISLRYYTFCVVTLMI